MLVINSIEKSRLQADSFSYSGSGVAWKARFVLFLGFALLAGGLAGSVVSAYAIHIHSLPWDIALGGGESFFPLSFLKGCGGDCV